jgi:hypothetical protein
LEFRSLASLAVWLHREEELVQLVSRDFKELKVLSKTVEEDDSSELPVLSKELFSIDCNLPSS